MFTDCWLNYDSKDSTTYLKQMNDSIKWLKRASAYTYWKRRRRRRKKKKKKKKKTNNKDDDDDDDYAI